MYVKTHLSSTDEEREPRGGNSRVIGGKCISEKKEKKRRRKEIKSWISWMELLQISKKTEKERRKRKKKKRANERLFRLICSWGLVIRNISVAEHEHEL